MSAYLCDPYQTGRIGAYIAAKCEHASRFRITTHAANAD